MQETASRSSRRRRHTLGHTAYATRRDATATEAASVRPSAEEKMKEDSAGVP